MRYEIELTFIVDAWNEADAYAIAGQITDHAEQSISGYEGYSRMVATPIPEEYQDAP